MCVCVLKFSVCFSWVFVGTDITNQLQITVGTSMLHSNFLSKFSALTSLNQLENPTNAHFKIFSYTFLSCHQGPMDGNPYSFCLYTHASCLAVPIWPLSTPEIRPHSWVREECHCGYRPSSKATSHFIWLARSLGQGHSGWKGLWEK